MDLNKPLELQQHRITFLDWGTIDQILLDTEKIPSCSAKLSGFETSFMESLRSKEKRYGRKLTLSEKQWSIIKQIEGKLYK